MLRSSRLALLASVVLIAATAPAAMASPGIVKTDQPVAKGDTLTVSVDTVPTFSLQVFEMSRPSFHPGDVADFSADSVSVGRFSERTRKAIQNASVDSAFEATMRARDFSPDTFAGAMLDSILDSHGFDLTRRITRECVVNYRLPSDQYRRILQAIANRELGSRNRSAAG